MHLTAFLIVASFEACATASAADLWNVAQAPDRDGIYYAGPQVAAPKLLKTVYVPYPIASAKQTQGFTALAMVIDEHGVPQHIQILHSHGDGFDQASIQAVQESNFSPGMRAGRPVPVWVDMRVVFYPDRSRTTPQLFIAERNLPAPPEAQFEDKKQRPLSYTPPILIHTVDADFADPFAKHPLVMVAVVTAVVGVDGLPKNVRIRRGLGFGLDEKAVAAVEHYRFLPATKKGKPVEDTSDVMVEFAKF
jgi:TonB family protein